MTFVIAEAGRHFLRMSNVNIREMSGANSETKLRRMFIKKRGLLNKEENDVYVLLRKSQNFWFYVLCLYVFSRTHDLVASTSTRVYNVLDLLRLACWLIRTLG